MLCDATVTNGLESPSAIVPGSIWRIVTKSNQPDAVRYPFGIIEMKKRDSGASTCGNPFDTTAVETKMAIPSLLTWIEEEDDFV